MTTIDDAPAELAYEIREFFPADEWDNAASIAQLESGFNVWAVDDTTDASHPCGADLGWRDGVVITAERSVSWFQLNSCNYPDTPWYYWFNTRANVGEAHRLWVDRGWAPWYFSARKLGLLS